jgi:hypothetical protein
MACQLNGNAHNQLEHPRFDSVDWDSGSPDVVKKWRLIMEMVISKAYIAEFNGFYGVGGTEREAMIACRFAATTLSLSATDGGSKTAFFNQLPASEQAKA